MPDVLAGRAVRKKVGRVFGAWHWTEDGETTLCGRPVELRGPTAQCVGTAKDMRWPGCRRRLVRPCRTCYGRMEVGADA